MLLGVGLIFSGCGVWLDDKGGTVRAPTKTTITAKISDSSPEEVIFTAHVKPSKLPVSPLGTVTFLFKETGAPISGCIDVPVNFIGEAVCQVPLSTVGEQPITVAYKGNNTFIESESAKLFLLRTTLAGTGKGDIHSTSPELDCGPKCDAFYLSGTSVTLTANPDAISVFSGWSGDCARSGASTVCTVSMNAAKNVTATFDLLPELTVNGFGTGTGIVTATGLRCDVKGGVKSGDCKEYSPAGTVVTLTASPSAGSVFSGFSGGGCGLSNPCQITMTSATAVTATFSLVFDLTTAKNGSGTGAVTSTPIGIICGGDCTESYVDGTSVALKATPDFGSVFVSWNGCDSVMEICASY